MDNQQQDYQIIVKRDYSCEGKLNQLGATIAGWAKDKGFDPGTWKNVDQKLLLMVTEIVEATQEFRKIKSIPEIDGGEWSEDDAKLVHKFHEEMSDLAIRLLSFCSEMGIDLEKEIVEKMRFNETRPYKHGRRI